MFISNGCGIKFLLTKNLVKITQIVFGQHCWSNKMQGFLWKFLAIRPTVSHMLKTFFLCKVCSKKVHVKMIFFLHISHICFACWQQSLEQVKNWIKPCLYSAIQMIQVKKKYCNTQILLEYFLHVKDIFTVTVSWLTKKSSRLPELNLIKQTELTKYLFTKFLHWIYRWQHWMKHLKQNIKRFKYVKEINSFVTFVYLSWQLVGRCKDIVCSTLSRVNEFAVGWPAFVYVTVNAVVYELLTVPG